MLKQRHRLFVGLLLGADAVVIAGAGVSAWVFRTITRGEAFPDSWENYLKEPQLLVLIPIVLASMSACGLYKPRRDHSLVTEIADVAKASLAATVLLLAVLWVIGAELVADPAATRVQPWEPAGAMFSGVSAARVQLPALLACLVVSLSVFRFGFRVMLRRLRAKGINVRHIAIIGTGRLGQIVARTVQRNSWTGFEVNGFISHLPETRLRRCLGKPVLGGLGDLEAAMAEHELDGVFIALPQARAGELPDLLRRLESFAVDVRVVPDVRARYVPRSMTVNELEGMPIISYRECPTSGLGGIGKRAIDLVGAGAALLLFSPLIALIGIVIALSGAGPVVYRQRRVSLGGEPFIIYKFRTMTTAPDDAADAGWTSREDSRITPFGRFLRRTSLDELPQLINVIQGRMSLVGPRPERPELIERFREDWRGYMLRQHVKAGMTGWAQIKGYRGDTSLRKRLQYDLLYIRNWSLWLDIRILFATLFRGFVHPNAH